MPVAVPLIAAAAAYGATAIAVAEGLVIAGSIGATLIGAGASLITSTVLGAAFSSSSSTPEPSHPDFTQALTQPGGGRTQQVRQPVSPHLIPYGRVKLSGPITFLHSKDDDGGRANGYLYLVHTLTGVRIKAIGDVYLNETLSSDSSYSGLVRVNKHLGASDQVADADLVSEIGGDNWTTEHRGRGRAYLATRLKWSQEVFAGGIPNISALVDGVDSIYDPRTEATGFTNNAALCIANWFTAAHGMGLEWSRLNEASVIAAANVCDERVRVFGETTTVSADAATDILTPAEGSRVLDWGDGVRISTSGSLPGGLVAGTTYYWIPASDGGGQLATSVANAFAGTAVALSSAGTGTQTLQYWDEARYKCNGTYTLDSPKRDVLEQLLSSMAGVVVYLGGSWYIHAGAAASPTVTLTADDLRADYAYTPKRSMRDRFNGVRAVLVNPDKSWQPTDLPPLLPSDALLDEDAGEELYSDIRLPFTTSARCGQRLMKIHLMRNRAQGALEFPAKLSAFQLAPWDGFYATISRGDGTYALEGEQFRVTSWALAEDGGIDVVGGEDSAAVYAWDVSEEQVVTAAQDVVLPDPSVIAAPASLTIETPTTPLFQQLAADWAAVPSIWRDGYDFEHRDSGDTNWNSAGRISDDSEGGDIDRAIVLTTVPTDMQVRAVTKNGSPSAYTQSLAPGAPGSPAAVGTMITWDNDPAADTVQVFSLGTDDIRNATLYDTVDGAGESVTVGNNAYYWLRSVGADGNISALTDTITVGTPP